MTFLLFMIISASNSTFVNKNAMTYEKQFQINTLETELKNTQTNVLKTKIEMLLAKYIKDKVEEHFQLSLNKEYKERVDFLSANKKNMNKIEINKVENEINGRDEELKIWSKRIIDLGKEYDQKKKVYEDEESKFYELQYEFNKKLSELDK